MRPISHVFFLLCVVVSHATAAAGGFTHFLGPDVSTHADQIVVNPDDTILIAGSILTRDPKTRVSYYDSFLLKLLADGRPDAQFGTVGWIRQPKHLFRRMEVLQDGSILILAGASLGKLTRSGHFDPRFGENGRLLTNFNERGATPDGMVLHTDGKISLIAIESPEFSPGVPKYLEMVRVTSDGKPDGSVGTGGKLRTRVPWTDLTVREVLQRGPGGFLLLCEEEVWESKHSLNYGGNYFLVALDGRGKPDMSYGQGGKLGLTHIGHVYIACVLQLHDGSIVLSGHATGKDRVGDPGFVAKLTPEGAPDRAFGAGGVVRMPIWGRGIAVDRSGKLYVSGIGSTKGSLLAVARFSSVGIPDAAFGQGGIVQEGVFGGAASGAQSVLAVSPRSGKVVVAGVTYPKEGQGGPGSNDSELVVARFSANGIFEVAGFGAGDIALAGPKAVAEEGVSVPVTGGGQHEESTEGEPPTVTGTIATVILRQPVVGVRMRNFVATPMYGKPYVVFTLKERPDVEYVMEFAAAASAGLVKVDKFDEEGIPQNAEIRPVQGWHVKVSYHKEGNTNQVSAVTRLKGDATDRPKAKRSRSEPSPSPRRQPAAR